MKLNGLTRYVPFAMTRPSGQATIAFGILLASIAMSTRSVLACATALAGSPPNQTDELNSMLPYHEVHIPFALRDGAVILKVNVSGVTVDCLLDTGSSGIVFPDTLGIATRPVGAAVHTTDAAGRAVKCQPAIVDSMYFGGFAIHNARAIVLKTTASGPKPDGFVAHTVMLGSQAFKDIVLSVDYAKSELIIRDSDYDFTLQSQIDALVLNFRLANATSAGFGLPVVSAHIAGGPARLVLDTGFTGPQFGLQNSYVSHNPDLKSAPRQEVDTSEISGNARIKYIKSVLLSLDTPGPIEIRGDALLMSANLHDIDGCLGASILSQFRVTFDFPRKRVLLEPNDPEYRNVLAGKKPWIRIEVGGAIYRLPPASRVSFLASAGPEDSNEGDRNLLAVTLGNIELRLPLGSWISCGATGAVVVSMRGFPDVFLPVLQSPSVRELLKAIIVHGTTYSFPPNSVVRTVPGGSFTIAWPGHTEFKVTSSSPQPQSTAEQPDGGEATIHSDGTVTITPSRTPPGPP